VSVCTLYVFGYLDRQIGVILTLISCLRVLTYELSQTMQANLYLQISVIMTLISCLNFCFSQMIFASICTPCVRMK